MRKLIAGLAVAALGVGVVASTAAAQTVSKFSVLAITKVAHQRDQTFVIKGPLAVPGDRSDHIGSFKARFSGPNGRHLRAVFFFSDGKLKVNGRQDHHKAPIVGGTGRWNGASGKAKFHSRPHDAELVTFTVVQG
jgi:hypothetical protein